MKPAVSIVMPVFNQLVYTKQCLVSLARNTHYSPYEVIIVDNNSTDGTREYLAEKAGHSGSFRYLTNEKNVGFTGAVNRGMQEAKGAYVVLLNNDTVLRPAWLDALVEMAESSPDIGIVGPKILTPGTDLIHIIGGLLFRKKGVFLHPCHGAHRLDPRFAKPFDCQYVEGSCMLVKRQVMDRIGILDMIYSPGYYEDTDYCFRAREAGFRSVYAPGSEIYHYAGRTSQSGRKDIPAGGENEKVFRKRWEHLFPD